MQYTDRLSQVLNPGDFVCINSSYVRFLEIGMILRFGQYGTQHNQTWICPYADLLLLKNRTYPYTIRKHRLTLRNYRYSEETISQNRFLKTSFPEEIQNAFIRELYLRLKDFPELITLPILQQYL